MRNKLHNRKVRKFLSFAEGQAEAIRLHGEKRGCHSFGEAVRDLARIAFDSLDKKNRPDKPQKESGDIQNGQEEEKFAGH